MSCDTVSENRVGRGCYHWSLQLELALTIVRSAWHCADGCVDWVSVVQQRICLCGLTLLGLLSVLR
jgi:hypothetical protein